MRSPLSLERIAASSGRGHLMGNGSRLRTGVLAFHVFKANRHEAFQFRRTFEGLGQIA
jgi:hypothetical protein